MSLQYEQVNSSVAGPSVTDLGNFVEIRQFHLLGVLLFAYRRCPLLFRRWRRTLGRGVFFALIRGGVSSTIGDRRRGVFIVGFGLFVRVLG